jgi:hypothetical protein
MKNISKRQFVAFLFAFLLGAIWLVAIRFVTAERREIHYHANFAVFVDGERLPFDNFTFYEEVASCGGEGKDNPRIRAHMHDQIGHVVHVHDNGATWGHFFANIGYVNGDTVFKTDKDTYLQNLQDPSTTITFILNGEEVQTTANRTIGDKDVLLISIGDASEEELQSQYDKITTDADFYNQNDDPSACSGEPEFTFIERLKYAVGISQ